MEGGQVGRTAVLSPSRLVLLDPVGVSSLQAQGLASRMAELDGRIIGFLDEGLMARYVPQFGELIRTWCTPADLPYWRKPLMSKPSPQALLEEVAGRCDGVILGYAH